MSLLKQVMKRQWQRYKELELIPDQPQAKLAGQPRLTKSITYSRRTRTSWLKTLWEIIDVALLRNLESRVWQSVDSNTGQTRWHLYDPASGRTRSLSSEAEVRQWLEQVFQR